MRMVTSALLVILGIVWTSAALPQTDRIVFDGVHVVPMDAERVLRDQRVVIADGRIQALGATDAVTIPDGYRVIAGNGGYLLPGLAEMHAHVPSDPDQREFLEDVLFLFVANGVTTARSMLGAPWHVELREQVAVHEVLGPRLFVAGTPLSAASVGSPEQARRVVHEQHAAGHDFMKLFSMEPDVFDAMVEAAREVGMPFGGHVPPAVGLESALAAGTASVDHLDGYMQVLAADAPAGTPAGFFGYGLVDWVDEARIPMIARATRDGGTWVVPTETLMVSMLAEETPESIATRPEMAYMPAETVAGWVQSKRNIIEGDAYDPRRARRYLELRAELLRALHEAGAGVLVGSDAPQVFNVPGFSVHAEMQLMHQAGLSRYDVLWAGTVGPARFFGAEDRFGRVSPGLEADLILVDGNPLEDLSVLEAPRGVMLRGRWLDRDTLDEGLDARRRE